MNKPKISIMIPVYNMRDVIGRAIESILSQDYDNKEILIMDGESNDGTIEVIEKYREHIDYFVSRKDKGPSDAMAHSIGQAHGEYITMLGADDYYEEGALSAVAHTIVSEQPDVAYGDCNFWYSNGRKIRKNAMNRGLENLYYYNALFSNAAYVKKDLLDSYYRNEWECSKGRVDINTDHLLWLLLYDSGKKFSYVKSENAITNYSVSGRSTINEFKGCVEDIDIINDVIGSDEKKKEKYLPTFYRYLAARTVMCYEDVLKIGELRDVIQKYLDIKKEYVIWGIGDMSDKVLRLLDICGKKPLYFVDNNYAVNSTGYNEYNVYSPKKLKAEDCLTVIISALGSEKAISEQIKGINSAVEIQTLVDIAFQIQAELGIDVLKKALISGSIR